MTAVLLLINLAFGNSATVAGIPVGSGLATIIAGIQLQANQRQSNTRLLRIAPSGYGLKVQWRAQALDPNRYRLTASAPQQR